MKKLIKININLIIKMMKSIFINLCALLCVFAIVSCEEKDENSKPTGTAYDPSKPVLLTGFKPDSGRIAEKVLFEGSNFGTDPEKISVYFNQKKGKVIGTTGTTMYVVVPRMPGDTCTVTVRVGDSNSPVLGKDSILATQTFRYRISVSVSTVVGNGTYEFRAGDLSYAQLRPRYITVDDDENLFVVQRSDGLQGLIRVNEKENIVTLLGSGMRDCNAITVDKETGIVTLPADTPPEIYYDANPAEGWAVRTRNLRLSFELTGGNSGSGQYKHAMAFCPLDGKVYVRYRSGDVARIDPKTYQADRIYTTAFGDVYGLAFHPLHPELLYIAMGSECGANAHSICVIDVTDPENSFRQLSAPNASGGFRDGKLENAQFRYPCQLYFDPDGNCYIADRDNHCIRKITPENMVETVVGIPGTSGFKDGNAEEALFSAPWGIGVSKDGTVYVADYDNGRVRKLAIE
jgi:DNA-binding beta-propeller fold protein YncE